MNISDISLSKFKCVAISVARKIPSAEFQCVLGVLMLLIIIFTWGMRLDSKLDEQTRSIGSIEKMIESNNFL